MICFSPSKYVFVVKISRILLELLGIAVVIAAVKEKRTNKFVIK